MSLEDHKDLSTAASPKQLSRPQLISQQSSSLPATPRQHPREFSKTDELSSPTDTAGHRSPRSVTSEIHRNVSSFCPTNPACRFQSTQTSRRRIPYTIGTDILGSEGEEPREALTADEERALSGDLRRLYDNLLPSVSSQENRKKVVEKLKQILQDEWPDRNVEVFMFGSSGNFLYTDKSDGLFSVFNW